MSNNFYQVRSEKIAVTGRSGSKDAPAIGEMEHCQCCGRRIKNVVVMSNGARIGKECAWVMEYLSDCKTINREQMYILRISNKQVTFFKNNSEVSITVND